MTQCCESAVIAAELGHIECLAEMNDRHELDDIDELELLEACMLHGHFECFRWITNTLQTVTQAAGSRLYTCASDFDNVAWFELLHSLGYQCDRLELVQKCVVGGSIVLGGSLACVKFALEVLKCPVQLHDLQYALRFSRVDMLQYLISKMTPALNEQEFFYDYWITVDDSEASIECVRMLADAGFRPNFDDIIRFVRSPMSMLKAVYRVSETDPMNDIWPFCFYAAAYHLDDSIYDSLEYCLSPCPSTLLPQLDEVVSQFAAYDEPNLSNYPNIRKLFLQYNKRKPNAEPIKTLVNEWLAYEAEFTAVLTDTCKLPTDVVKYEIMSFL